MIKRLLLGTMVALFVLIVFGYVHSSAQERQRRGGGGGGFQGPDSATMKANAAEIDKYLAEVNEQIKGKEEKPVTEVFKNIKALDPKMPSGRLPGIMAMWSRNLGVSCKTCHVVGEWDKDDQVPKESARGMMAMVNDLNTKTLPAIKGMDEGSRVGCWTCHRGQRHPQSRPPMERKDGGKQ